MYQQPIESQAAYTSKGSLQHFAAIFLLIANEEIDLSWQHSLLSLLSSKFCTGCSETPLWQFLQLLGNDFQQAMTKLNKHWTQDCAFPSQQNCLWSKKLVNELISCKNWSFFTNVVWCHISKKLSQPLFWFSGNSSSYRRWSS